MSVGMIYIATSKTSGKMYVGKTTHSLHQRIQSHMHRKGTALYRAILKYGIDSFEFVTIDSVPEELLCEWEMYFIKELGTLSPGGYNLTEGGEGGRLSQETIEKIRIRLKGRKPSDACMRASLEVVRKGLKRSKETCQKISEGKLKACTKRPDAVERARLLGLSKPHLGFHHSQETKDVLSKNLKGRSWRIVDGKRTWFPRVA